jgi:hypothetical protein
LLVPHSLHPVTSSGNIVNHALKKQFQFLLNVD